MIRRCDRCGRVCGDGSILVATRHTGGHTTLCGKDCYNSWFGVIEPIDTLTYFTKEALRDES